MTRMAVAVAVLLSGCAFAPGMSLDQEAAMRRAREANKDPRFAVRTITAEVIAAQAEAPAGEELVPDPHGNAPPPPYLIAPHDVLQVTVWAHPELTAPTGNFRSPEENGNPVNDDGTIFYPYVGVVEVAGKTVQQVRVLLTEGLSRVVPNAQLDVRIASYRGRKVQVTGEIHAPSAMPITNVPQRVQDAIAWAKGPTPEADLANVTLTRDGVAHRLDLLAFYEGGDASQNWLLRDGDVVNVGDRNANRVFIMGEVRRQQARLMVKRRMTLAEAIGESDGLDPANANVSQIYVIRGDFAAPEIFRLDASSADALVLATSFQLRPRDVVFVAPYEIARWNRAIGQIAPTVQLLFQAAVTADIATRTR